MNEPTMNENGACLGLTASLHLKLESSSGKAQFL